MLSLLHPFSLPTSKQDLPAWMPQCWHTAPSKWFPPTTPTPSLTHSTFPNNQTTLFFLLSTYSLCSFVSIFRVKRKKGKKFLSPSDFIQTRGECLSSCGAKKPPWGYLDFFFLFLSMYFFSVLLSSLTKPFLCCGSVWGCSQGCGKDLAEPRFSRKTLLFALFFSQTFK